MYNFKSTNVVLRQAEDDNKKSFEKLISVLTTKHNLKPFEHPMKVRKQNDLLYSMFIHPTLEEPSKFYVGVDFCHKDNKLTIYTNLKISSTGYNLSKINEGLITKIGNKIQKIINSYK